MKEVCIGIHVNDFHIIKANDYKLCIAGGTAEDCCDIVGVAIEDYFEKNLVKWDEDYRIFFCKSIGNRQILQRVVTPVRIEPGQYVTVDPYGSMSKPASGSCKDQIGLVNDFGVLYPGLERKIGYLNKEFYVPVFVAPRASIKGSYSMKPADIFWIWFEQNIQSETIILEKISGSKKAGRSNAVRIDMSDCDRTSIFYEDGDWR